MKYSEYQIQNTLDRSQIRQLPLMTWGIGTLFILYALAQWFLLKEKGYPVIVAFALFCAAGLFSLNLVYRRLASPENFANSLIGTIAILVLASTHLRLYATGEPKQSANLILFMVAAGVVFVSTRWFLVLLGLSLGGWAVWVLLLPAAQQAESDWVFWGLVLASSAATAAILHSARAQVVLRSVKGEVRERAQKIEIKHRVMQLEVNAGVGQNIAAILKLDRLLPKITSLIQQNYQIGYVGVFLPENRPILEKIEAAAESGEYIYSQQIPDEKSWKAKLQSVFQNGMLSAMDESNPIGPAPEQTTLLLPLKMGKNRLGVLALQSQSKSLLRPSDEQVFQLLANQVSNALENARLYDQIMQMNQELESKVGRRTKELQEAYARLERLNQTKSDFITIASHELKTPLTLINVYNEMLGHDEFVMENEPYRKWTEKISRGTHRLNEIVDRMNDVAMIDNESLSLYFAPVNVQFLLNAIQSYIKPDLAKRQIDLFFHGLADLPEIEADTEALEKVLLHLLTNAIKYTPDGGTIKVDGRYHQKNGEQPTQIEIIISDSGIGIDTEAKELIFEKFYQTGEVSLHSSGKTNYKGGGAGLGLTIAKGIIEAHGGSIWVESSGFNEEMMPGSQFHIVIPIQQPLL